MAEIVPSVKNSRLEDMELNESLMNKTKHGIVSSSPKDQNVKGKMQWVLDFEI